MKIVVTSEAQIRDIDVYVERIAAAAALCGDKSGQVPLKTVKLEKFDWNKVGHLLLPFKTVWQYIQN